MTRCLGLVSILIALAFPASMVQTVTFAPSDLNFTQANGYDVIALNGALSTMEEGTPLLPLVNLNLLIPPSAEIQNVRVRSFDRYEVPGEYYLHPVQRPRPLSIQNPPAFIQPDPVVYASDQAYPASIASIVPSGCMSGYRIAGVKICPVQYTPATGKLVLFTRLELEIEYAEGVNEVYPMTDNQVRIFSEQVAGLVVNADQVETFAPPQKESFNNVDYVIITSSALVSAFTPLKDWKTKKGLNTVIMSLDTIYARYPGRDNQERIRNFIIDYWRNRGLVYVLIGGDDVLVPVRFGYLTDPVHSTGSIPTDLYYADLQWSWDGNRNNQFGEFRGDTLDLFYDVFVGRCPNDNATHVANFIRKDTIYEKRLPDTTYLKRIVMPSEWLWSSIGYHGRICNRALTAYFPTAWRRSRIDDPTGAQIRDSLNVGYNFCHTVGHGSPSQVGVLTMNLVPTLTNATRLNIMNSIACDCGSFDAKECMAETLINYANGGCVANMLNSRFGWGAPPLMGSSEQLSMAFYRQLWQGAWEVGPCHALAKDELRNVAMTQYGERWSHYALNLFGDPALPMYTDTPKSLTVNCPASILTGPRTVRVTVTSSGNPVKNALACIVKGTEFHASGYTNSSGWVDLPTNATTIGSADLTITARNFSPNEGTVTFTTGSAAPALVFQSLYVDDSNNHRLDPGETANLIVTLKNFGAAAANNVRGTLRTTSSYLTLVDSTSLYGNIATGDTARGDVYRVSVSSSAPHGTEAELLVNAVANEGTWQPFTRTRIGVFMPASRVWATHDTAWLLLTVTCLGSIGTTDWWGEGHGFIYPDTAAWTSSKLFHGSMVCGTDPTYMVDRFYGVPCSIINKDFRVVDSIKPCIPPAWGHEEYLATYDDGYHPAAKNLQVTQRSLALYDGGYDDFVIIIYDYLNRGTSAINNFHSSVILDLRCTIWSQLDNSDYGFVDPARRFVFLKNSSTTRNHSYGLRLLDPRTARNVSLINLTSYTGLGEATKDSFVTAKRTITTGTTPANWAVIASAGPVNLAAGGRYRAAYAIVGGHDTTQAKAHSDSAQSWYDRFLQAEEEPVVVLGAHTTFKFNARIFSQQLAYAYDLGPNEHLAVCAYDISGRQVATILDRTGSATGKGVWKPQRLSGGVYFLRINDRVEKIIYLR